MSKYTKLLNQPGDFFRDMLHNRLQEGVKYASKVVGKELYLTTLPAKKIAAKTAVPKTSVSKQNPSKVLEAKSTSTIDLNHVNRFLPLSMMLHCGEGVVAGQTHLSLWLPSFIRAEVPFVVIVRNLELFAWVKNKFPWISVGYAKSPVDIEEVFNQLPFIKTVFYTSNTGNNIHLVRISALKHIFIGHGDSDKAASAHKALRLYDEIWTAGQAHVDRFKNAKFDKGHLKFIRVGRPNLKNSLALTSQNWLKRMPLTFLYLPTWEGFVEEHNYSSLHLSSHFMQELKANYDCQILSKFHPLTGSRNQLFKNFEKDLQSIQWPNQNIEVIDRLTSVDSLISKANIFICDISAVVTECLAANAPIFVYIPEDKDIQISKSNMIYSDYCYTFSSIPELLEKVSLLMQGQDELANIRSEACEYFIGKNETLTDEFIKNLQNISFKKSLEANSRIYAVL